MRNVHSNFNMMEMSLDVLDMNRTDTDMVVNALLNLEAVVHDIDDGEMFSDDGEHRVSTVFFRVSSVSEGLNSGT